MAQLPVITIADVTAVSGEARHRSCTKAVLHQDDPAETSVFRVKPGGAISTHLHSRVFDLFIGVAGRVDITYEGQEGSGCFKLKRNSFCRMPPGVRHEVRNPSKNEEAVFVLIHAPSAGYDFIPVKFKRKPASKPAAAVS